MQKLLLIIGLLLVAGITRAFAQDASTLSRFDATPETVVRELETLGMFPSGGALAFDGVNSTLVGSSQFITLDIDNEHTNFVFGGEIALISDTDTDELETCALVAHAVIESGSTETETTITEYTQINTFVDVGITNAGEVYIVDRYGTEQSDLSVEVFDSEVTDSIYLLAIMLDESLTVYLDGEIIITDYETVAPAGGFAFALETVNPRATCTGTNLWAYTLPDDFVTGRCEITTEGVINKREGGNTNFDVVGQMTTGEVEEAIGQSTDDEGFTWWQLEPFAWVREDVVTAVGDCRTLPQR